MLYEWRHEPSSERIFSYSWSRDYIEGAVIVRSRPLFLVGGVAGPAWDGPKWGSWGNITHDAWGRNGE